MRSSRAYGDPAPGGRPQAEDRSHLARLCKGFLLAREEDPRRAEAFLVTFLSELDRAFPEGPRGPTPPTRQV